MIRRYSFVLESPSEDWDRIVVLHDGNRLMVLDRQTAELMVKQMSVLVDAIKAMESITDANGESAS